MVQLKSDIYRQQAYMNASHLAKREAAGEFGPSPMYERLVEIREREARKSARRRGFPWMIVLSILSFSYFVLYGKDMMKEAIPVIQEKAVQVQMQQAMQNRQDSQGIQDQQRVQAMQHLQAAHGIQGDLQAEDAQADAALNALAPDEKATISITVGGQTITREMTLQEIQQMQHMQSMSGQM